MNIDKLAEYCHLQLNEQQYEAVRAVKGPGLLLAVPGSGKTTVLVIRLGYMILGCGIAPENILTLTYTVAAARDMAKRFRQFFGNIEGGALADRMEFRTINGICASVIYQYGRMIGKTAFELVNDEKRITAIIAEIYRKVQGSFASESDLKGIRTQITYIKNMMLTPHEVEALDKESDYRISEIYRQYNQTLKASGLMDYDDQMIYAYKILKSVPQLLQWYRDRYHYICVDEAQDTSRIQHAIIALLAAGRDNLFMVGDEDQSIYGFRAAYPKALLDFDKDHPGAKILLMEENYRSNSLIVEAADRFIQQNTLRHKKTMRAAKGEGTDIRGIALKSRNAQYTYLLKVAESCAERAQTDSAAGIDPKEETDTALRRTGTTAVLYRDNESVLPLVDLLERNGISYRMRSGDLTFFSHRIVNDIRNIILFAEDPCNTEAFLQIYYKISTYLNKQTAAGVCDISAREHLPVLEAALRYGGLPPKTEASVRRIQTQLKNLSEDAPAHAISRMVDFMGYGEYLERAELSDNKIHILKALARQEETVSGFVARLDELAQIIRDKKPDYSSRFILSTIHASKGLEYDTVYLMDVADGIFPESVPQNLKKADQTEIQIYEEERRLFYVGVTRAREELNIFKFGDGSTFRRQLMLRQPKADLSVFQVGARVEHNTYGSGVILARKNDRASVRFGVIVKKLNLKVCAENDLMRVVK